MRPRFSQQKFAENVNKCGWFDLLGDQYSITTVKNAGRVCAIRINLLSEFRRSLGPGDGKHIKRHKQSGDQEIGWLRGTRRSDEDPPASSIVAPAARCAIAKRPVAAAGDEPMGLPRYASSAATTRIPILANKIIAAFRMT